MRYLLVFLSALLLSGCFDPTLDISTAETRKQSYNELLQSLPEEERERFDALVIYYLEEYEIAGHIQQNDLSDLDGLTADEIYDVVTEHKDRIDDFMAEEMAAYDEYQQYKDENPDQFASDFMKVSSVVEGDSVAGTYVEITSIVIQSLVDELEVRSLVANRGNCELLYTGQIRRKQLPKMLKYGESIEIPLRSNCDLIEADIDTSHGAATYTFQG